MHDKLFWFGDYEGVRTLLGTPAFATVPTPQMFSGDFAGLPTIYDPLTYNSATGTKTSFPNNVIPQARTVGFAQKYLQFFPLPNSAPIASRGNANVLGETDETLTRTNLRSRSIT